MNTLKLLTLLSVICCLSYSAASEPAGTETSEDAELRQLLESWRDTLKGAVEIQRIRVGQGNMSITDFRRTNAELQSAELELARTKAERIDILESSIKEWRALEDRLLAMQAAGLLDRGADLLVKADRIKVEIALYRVRNGE